MMIKEIRANTLIGTCEEKNFYNQLCFCFLQILRIHNAIKMINQVVVSKLHVIYSYRA